MLKNWIDVKVVVLVLISALLIFPGLGGTSLWTDEAHTAVIAQNIAETGFPYASNGKNLVSIFPDHRDIRDGIYIWQAWIPSYLAAVSVSVLGNTAFAARLPFALLFILLIVASYHIFNSWQPDRQRSLLAIALMLGCVALLLHARQCRYYILVPLLNLLIVYSYLKLLEQPNPFSATQIVIWTTLLFNSLFPAAPILGLALGVDLIFRRPDRHVLKYILVIVAILLLINMPIAWYTRVWDRQFGIQPGYSSIPVFSAYLFRYAITINTYIFPLILVFVALVWRWREVLRKVRNDPIVFLLLTICVTQLLFFSLASDYPFTRYMLGILPFVLYLGAACIRGMTGNSMVLSWSLVVVITISNTLQVLPLSILKYTRLQQANWTTNGVNGSYLDVKNVGLSYAKGEIKTIINTPMGSPLIQYILSALNSPKGPIDWIVKYLNENALPSDRVKISYGDLPLMFHTNFSVISAPMVGPSAPEWFIPRTFNPPVIDKNFVESLNNHKYELVELNAPDIQWNNRPDPLYHFYNTPVESHLPKIKIYRKIEK
ncbi:MAG: hypothetical protein OEZ68_20540 [Gammaproteobacteria bacterium]|nr:hypothetical protein [Gammaproteobacteria bacterium]MDH5803193.1 hypothetical protein [Gammaproteobacteria bacterium]